MDVDRAGYEYVRIQTALGQLEEREREGSISIGKLEEVANAMKCRLVYGFIPDHPLTPDAIDLERRQQEARRGHRRMPRPR